MRAQMESSDLTIICHGAEFQAHKAVVCAQSPVFHAALKSNFKTRTLRKTVIDYARRIIDARFMKKRREAFDFLASEVPSFMGDLWTRFFRARSVGQEIRGCQGPNPGTGYGKPV
ncbi:hypothetical protein BJX61DRAFT_544656 [Aspergillus egyptiacus]|nr:hypothetical protein BJX61DRAFT_544656 [Aspergillus egyptiacus]